MLSVFLLLPSCKGVAPKDIEMYSESNVFLSQSSS